MSPGDFADLMMAVSIIGTIALSVGFMTFVRAWSRRYAKGNSETVIQGYDPDAIARLQASVDAISIEVERISEGQRFTTRLLNETVGDKSRIGSGQ
ncbi:MAG: hypothetical protein ABI556_01630 [Gemmatimonadales bacterium]